MAASRFGCYSTICYAPFSILVTFRAAQSGQSFSTEASHSCLTEEPRCGDMAQSLELTCQQAAERASSTKEEKVAWVHFACQVCQMKAVLVRDFLRHFAKRRNEPLQVHQRGKVLGTWTPNQATPDPIDVLARAK